MRYFFEIAYHGKPYHGWQRQNNATGVQQVVEECMSTILGQTVEITGSGRTDSGVHCRKQYFHIDLDIKLNEKHLIKFNSFLPATIVLRAFHLVDGNAHARYDAVERCYEYHISQKRNPFELDQSMLFLRPLDLSAMGKAGSYLKGEQDFRSFSKVKTDVNTFICHIFEASWKQQEDKLVFTIRANRFLRGMVRAIVGTLIDVGEHKITPEEIKEIILSGDRRKAGFSAPPEGLFLTDVRYPDNYFKD